MVQDGVPTETEPLMKSLFLACAILLGGCVASPTAVVDMPRFWPSMHREGRSLGAGRAGPVAPLQGTRALPRALDQTMRGRARHAACPTTGPNHRVKRMSRIEIDREDRTQIRPASLPET